MKETNKKTNLKKRKVAVFDIDGTIFRSSLLIELVDVLIERELFPEKARNIFDTKRILWLERKGNYESYIMAVVEVFMKYIRGIHYKDVLDASEEVFRRKKDHTYVYTRSAVAKLKKQRYFLLAVSLSPKTIVDIFAKYFGFDKSYGIFYTIGPSEQFDGKIQDADLIRNKSAIVKRAIEKENLTLVDSYGFGDTEGDIAMLEMVDNPVAFNPNVKLFKVADRSGWRIVIERKDAILETKDGKSHLATEFRT